jgi:septal ring factor EnvC (AmiA/AmiB activator)
MKLGIRVLLGFSSVVWLVIVNLIFIDFSGAAERSATEITRSQIQQTEKYLLEQQSELHSVDVKQNGILAEIERLERDVAINRASLRQLSGQIEKLSVEIQQGQKRIQELNRSSHATKESLKGRLAAFYKFGRPGYVRLLVTSASVQDFQKVVKYMKAIMDQDRQVLDMLGRQRSHFQDELTALRENMANVEALREAKDRSMLELERCIEEKVLLLMRVHREKEFYAKAVKELKEASETLNEAIIHLELGERERALPEGFAAMKGKLPLPLEGEVIKDVEELGSNPFLHRKGIYIKGNPMEEVRSVFPGRVDYSGWFKGYGQLLIINHGSRYYTVYAHLEDRIKQRGETVSGGEAVALVGDLGWQMGPGLYFEIRRGGDYLDPMGWLKAR